MTTPENNPQQVLQYPAHLLDALQDLAAQYPNADPAELPQDDPTFVNTQVLIDSWRESWAPADTEEGLTQSIVMTTLHYEAGFRNQDYLDEVANDWLVQDLDKADKAGYNDLAFAIMRKIYEINKAISPAEDLVPMEIGLSLHDLIDQQDCIELFFTKDAEEARSYAVTVLIENGYEDPETILTEKGILGTRDDNA